MKNANRLLVFLLLASCESSRESYAYSIRHFPKSGDSVPECPSLEEARKKFIGLQYKSEGGKIIDVIDGPRKSVSPDVGIVDCIYTVELDGL